MFKYAKLGGILGHEIFHAFSGDSINYNKDGIWQNWWSVDTTKNTFDDKVQCFINQYKNYKVYDIANQTIYVRMTIMLRNIFVDII